MRTIDELKVIPMGFPPWGGDTTKAEREKLAAFYVRLGGLCEDMTVHDPLILMSQAIATAKTWRGTFAWRLATALGWRRCR